MLNKHPSQRATNTGFQRMLSFLIHFFRLIYLFWAHPAEDLIPSNTHRYVFLSPWGPWIDFYSFFGNFIAFTLTIYHKINLTGMYWTLKLYSRLGPKLNPPPEISIHIVPTMHIRSPRGFILLETGSYNVAKTFPHTHSHTPPLSLSDIIQSTEQKAQSSSVWETQSLKMLKHSYEWPKWCSEWNARGAFSALGFVLQAAHCLLSSFNWGYWTKPDIKTQFRRETTDMSWLFVTRCHERRVIVAAVC